MRGGLRLQQDTGRAHDNCNDHTVHGAVFRFTGNEDDPYGSLTTRGNYAYDP